MTALKLVGAAGVFGALCWCGMQGSRWYHKRLQCLLSWQNALMEARRELCDLGERTEHWLEWLEGRPLFHRMAGQCLAALREETGMEQAWRRAVEGAGFPLQGEELETVAALGSVLGRYDGEEQRLELEQAMSRLGEYTIRAEEEKTRLGRMWPVLGISGGALAVVLLL